MIENISDYMARACDCGCVRFNLLRSGNIECDNCQNKQSNLIWRIEMTEEQINKMVDKFLSWKIPADFSPDCGITFTPLNHPNSWPIGTNLLTAAQAKAMIKHMLGECV